MTAQELKDFNKGRKIAQIGFVTRDIKKAMKNWVEYLHVGPWRIVTLSDKSVTGQKYRFDRILEDVHEPFKFICALTRVGDMEIELIQPVYGPTIYRKFLEEKGEGLHHVKEKISGDDWENTIENYRQKGMGVTQSGLAGRALYAYFDTEPLLDFVMEIGNCPENNVLPPECEVAFYPEE